MDKGDLIFATDMQESAPALQMADVKIIVPSVYDPNYIDSLMNICISSNINVLISLNDLELPLIANNKKEFEKLGVTTIVSDPPIIDIAFDKYKTALWLEQSGLKSPKTFISVVSVLEALSNADICFPLFMKPRWGSGSIGLEVIDDIEDLNIYYKILSKKIKKSILSTASIGEDDIIIQEKLTGTEFGLDIMNDLLGNNVSVSVKQKLSMRAGETDKAITVYNPELISIGRKIGQKLKHIGNLDVDIMQNSKGDYCVLELNPRFGGGFPFSYEAGANLPKAIIEWTKGNSIDPSILNVEYNKMYAKNDYLTEIR